MARVKASSGGKPGNPAGAIELLAVFLAVFLFHAAIEQVLTPTLAASDAWYHTKIAALYWSGECPILGGDFPWTQFSRFHELRHDWHLLYHILLIPFVWLGPVGGGKLSVVFFAATLATVLYGVVRRNGLPAPLAATLLVLFVLASASQILRLHLPRPSTGMLALLLLLVHFSGRERALAAFLTSVFLLLLYNVPHTLVLLAGVTAVVIALREGRLPWATLGALLGGIAVGVVAHPGFWHWEGSFWGLEHADFSLWRQMSGTLEAARNDFRIQIAGQWVTMRVGNEFKPPVAQAFPRIFAVPLLVPLAAAALAAQRRRLSHVAAIALVLAAAYFTLFLEFIRFVEYWIPLAFLGAGCLVAESLAGVDWDAWEERARPWHRPLVALALLAGIAQVAAFVVAEEPARARVWIPTVVALLCLPLRTAAVLLLALRGHRSLTRARRRALGAATLLAALAWGPYAVEQLYFVWSQGPMVIWDPRAEALPEPARWLAQNSQPGDLVYQDNWALFPFLFHYNHKNHYMVGFDPYFFYQYDPQRYRTWILAVEGRLSAAELRAHLDDLGARFVVATKLQPAFRERMAAVPGTSIGYQDEFTTVYRVDRAPSSGP